MATTKRKEYPGLTKIWLSSGMAGATEAMLLFPAEFLKTQLQLHEKSGNKASMSAIIKQTYETRGVGGFYRGVSSLVLGSFLKVGVRFLTFSSVGGGAQSVWEIMVAGITTGAVEACLVVTPFETLKTKLIHDQKSAKSSLVGMLRKIIREEGVRGLWRGNVPTVIRQGANSMVRFTVYDRMKRLIQTDRNQPLTFSQSLLAGTTAGFVNVYLTMPFDVVKTRLQGLDGTKYKGVFDCARQTVTKEGVLTLWKGALPRLARVGPSGGIVFSVQEVLLRWMTENLPKLP